VCLPLIPTGLQSFGFFPKPGNRMETFRQKKFQAEKGGMKAFFSVFLQGGQSPGQGAFFNKMWIILKNVKYYFLKN
jgi:hypothetical protein